MLKINYYILQDVSLWSWLQDGYILNVAVIGSRHRGQVVNKGAHFLQANACLQGKNKTFQRSK